MIYNPLRIIRDISSHRDLLIQLVKRDVLLRYRGAMFGVLWIFLSPLLMLAIFAFVFGQVFQARWPQQATGVPFWILLYVGLMTFNLFSDTISRAPTAVRTYPSYVKKIIFPVEILPLIPLGAALIHLAFNFLVMFVALAVTGFLHASILMFPFLLIPVILLSTGLGWFLAAWGVFIKDMTQIVPIFVQMALFLSPVFYSVGLLPLALRSIYLNNPLAAIIVTSRAVITGNPIPWTAWWQAFALSMIVFILGYAFFQHSREEFADVL